VIPPYIDFKFPDNANRPKNGSAQIKGAGKLCLQVKETIDV